ncbi:putative sulfate exporter family transporter, partial [uncultured Bartonella sp.]|uniref:YeiH family protein n=1 Tax=uncultured Bartonella sp. TaxID=104108 RepID=UPI00262EAD23
MMFRQIQPIIYRFAPGIFLCCIISVAAIVLEKLEKLVFGQAWLESLVLAILVGALIRTVKGIPSQYAEGVGFSAKILLECAVVLLGSSISVHAVMAAGFGLLGGIIVIVACVIVLTYVIGRLFGLTPRLALLVACGNSICGNSAIAAVAPVIKAEGSDVAASIAFTAALGIVVILLLPLTVPSAGLSFTQYGVLAGMTVYAVPQVLAAAAPVSLISVQTATLIKLVRVLMLGPVIFVIGLIYGLGGNNKLKFSKM